MMSNSSQLSDSSFHVQSAWQTLIKSLSVKLDKYVPCMCITIPSDFSESPWEAPWGHRYKSREPRVSCHTPRKTSRVLLRSVLRLDSPTMTREQWGAPPRHVHGDLTSVAPQESPWAPRPISWESPTRHCTLRKPTRCPRHREMRAFFSCMA